MPQTSHFHPLSLDQRVLVSLLSDSLSRSLYRTLLSPPLPREAPSCPSPSLQSTFSPYLPKGRNPLPLSPSLCLPAFHPPRSSFPLTVCHPTYEPAVFSPRSSPSSAPLAELLRFPCDPLSQLPPLPPEKRQHSPGATRTRCQGSDPNQTRITETRAVIAGPVGSPDLPQAIDTPGG